MCLRNNLGEVAIIGRGVLLGLSRQGTGLWLLGAVVIWLSAAGYSLADKIVLMDGDIIEGVITKQDRSVVVLEHGDLGRLEIARSRIKSV
ncbi:MAG: hypothetical protein JSU65_04575, partial [Candidatus Zixiibacteriota bacterium]